MKNIVQNTDNYTKSLDDDVYASNTSRYEHCQHDHLALYETVSSFFFLIRFPLQRSNSFWKTKLKVFFMYSKTNGQVYTFEQKIKMLNARLPFRGSRRIKTVSSNRVWHV